VPACKKRKWATGLQRWPDRASFTNWPRCDYVALFHVFLWKKAVHDMSSFKHFEAALCSSRSLNTHMHNTTKLRIQISTTCTLSLPNLPLPSNIIAAFTKTVLSPPNRPPQTLSHTTALTP